MPCIKFGDGSQVKRDTPLSGLDVVAELGLAHDGGIVAWKVNNYLRPLDWKVEDDSEAEFVSIKSSNGLRIYCRSLDFLFVIACRKQLNRKAILRHSIDEGHYWGFADGKATQDDARELQAAMHELVEQDIPFVRELLPIDKAKRIFAEQGEPEIADLFFRANIDPVEVYRCGEQYGYFGGPMAPSTGMLKPLSLRRSLWGLCCSTQRNHRRIVSRRSAAQSRRWRFFRTTRVG